VRGNPQALFGKRPTEKDPAKGTSSAVDFTRREVRGNGPGAIPAPRPGPTQRTPAPIDIADACSRTGDGRQFIKAFDAVLSGGRGDEDLAMRLVEGMRSRPRSCLATRTGPVIDWKDW